MLFYTGKFPSSGTIALQSWDIWQLINISCVGAVKIWLIDRFILSGKTAWDTFSGINFVSSSLSVKFVAMEAKYFFDAWIENTFIYFYM